MVLVTCSGFPGRGTIIGGAMAPLAPPLSTSLVGKPSYIYYKYVALKLYFCIFLYIAKIVITTGLPEEKGIKSEVIDLTNPCLKCDRIENIPKRWGSIGGVLKNQPLIGGGYVTDEYFR